MRATKSVPLVAAVLAVGLLIAGCGGDSGSATTPPNRASTSTPGPASGLTAVPSATVEPTATGGSTPVVQDETAAGFAARAFAVSDAAARAKSCPQTERFYRDFLLPPLATALIDAPGGCQPGDLESPIKYRVSGVRAYDPKNFVVDPIPKQALAPLADAERVVRVDFAGATKQEFVNFWLVVSTGDRFYLFHPVLFQISTCFSASFELLPGAPSWCSATADPQ